MESQSSDQATQASESSSISPSSSLCCRCEQRKGRLNRIQSSILVNWTRMLPFSDKHVNSKRKRNHSEWISQEVIITVTSLMAKNSTQMTVSVVQYLLKWATAFMPLKSFSTSRLHKTTCSSNFCWQWSNLTRSEFRKAAPGNTACCWVIHKLTKVLERLH